MSLKRPVRRAAAALAVLALAAGAPSVLVRADATTGGSGSGHPYHRGPGPAGPLDGDPAGRHHLAGQLAVPGPVPGDLRPAHHPARRPGRGGPHHHGRRPHRAGRAPRGDRARPGRTRCRPVRRPAGRRGQRRDPGSGRAGRRPGVGAPGRGPGDAGPLCRGQLGLRARPGAGPRDGAAHRDGGPRRGAGGGREHRPAAAGRVPARSALLLLRPDQAPEAGLGLAVRRAVRRDPEPPRLRLRPAGAGLAGLRDRVGPGERDQRPGLRARGRRSRSPGAGRPPAPGPLGDPRRPAPGRPVERGAGRATAAVERAWTRRRCRSRSVRRTRSPARCSSAPPTSAPRPRRTCRR